MTEIEQLTKITLPVANQAQNAEFEKDEDVTEAVQNLLSRLYAVLYDKHNKNFDAAASHIEQKTNTKREQWVYVAVGVLIIYMVIGSMAELVCNLVGFAYPAYASVKAVRTERKDDDTEWLIYWTVFACYSLLDFFADGIMSFFPFYWLIKAIFLLYLYLPQTRGGRRLYTKYVDPAIIQLDTLVAKWTNENKA